MVRRIAVALLFTLVSMHSVPVRRSPLRDASLARGWKVSRGGPRIYLLSFPKSGNTWMRYCIELLTGRATRQYSIRPKAQDQPLANTYKHPLDSSKAPVWKIHNGVEFNVGRYRHNPARDSLILLIRNPKEAIARWMMGSITGAELLKGSGPVHIKNYFDNLSLYHSWDASKKIMIYYEDFIRDPEGTMRKVVKFLGDSEEKFDDFFNNYLEHKARCIEFYGKHHEGGSQSRGDDLLYHSRKMTARGRAAMDEYMKKSYAELWDAYLAGRYAEEVLHNI